MKVDGEMSIFLNVIVHYVGLEDEYHFIFVCPEYNFLRLKYLPYIYQKQPNYHRFQSLLASDNELILRNLCKFILHAYKTRESKLK